MYDGIMYRCGQTVARATLFNGGYASVQWWITPLFNGGLRLCSTVDYASVQRWITPLFNAGLCLCSTVELRLFSSVGYASVHRWITPQGFIRGTATDRQANFIVTKLSEGISSCS